jgi:hypothetical protein
MLWQEKISFTTIYCILYGRLLSASYDTELYIQSAT